MNDITQDEYNDVVLSVKEQLGYEFLINNTSINRNTLNLIVDIVVSVYCMPEDKSLVINKNSVPVSVIKEKYCELEAEHISYVVECLENQSKTQTIRYLRKYLISSLFNAPDTIDAYYEAQVNLDMEKITG